MKKILSSILIAIMLISSMLTFTACELDLSNLPFDIPIDEIKDALDQHNWEYYYTIEEPTCSKKGVDLYSCSDCGLIKKVDTPTLEHTYGHWIIDKAPTDAEDGLKHRECLICGYKTEPEPASTTGLQSYTLGMGIVVDIDSSTDTRAHVVSTVATVVMDTTGKILLCRIDVADNKMYTDAIDPADYNFRSKMELGDEYGMGSYGPSGIEWYKQAQAFENYVVGMTAEDVANIKTQKPEGSGSIISADDALLSAGCTIDISDFIEAVKKACTDTNSMTFTAYPNSFTLGVAISSSAEDSYGYKDGRYSKIVMRSDFASAVICDEKILASLNDAIRPEFDIEYDYIFGVSFNGLYRELKHLSDMVWGDNNNDGIILQWYQQSEAFSKHVVGMTADDVQNMQTAANSAGYQMSTDDALLSAGCTIDITPLKTVLAKAARYAR